MNRPDSAEGPERAFDAINLISDPIYGYCAITKQLDDGSGSEQALLDDPWMQRQRRIHQLQSAWWVFPTAEHSRFQHGVGAMHLTGLFAEHLYPSLAESFPQLPSRALVVETMRIAGLMHDIGHGPFGHFFDTEVLAPFGTDHEEIGRRLVTGPLSSSISSLRRSPEGDFASGESIDPAWVAWVMEPPGMGGFEPPAWLAALKPVLCGLASTDNMDYVPRDAYMCGVAVGRVDVLRLRHYMFIKDGLLVLHQHGAPALEVFLWARLHMYNHVYFHRTVRRIDIHMRPLFRATCSRLLPPGNPADHLTEFQLLTDWSLIAEVDRLQHAPRSQEERDLGRAWEAITKRRLPWRLAFEAFHEFSGADGDPRLRDQHWVTSAIRGQLPELYREVGLMVDLAVTAPRPDNPASEGQLLNLFDPISGRVETEAAPRMLARVLPARTLWLRVYSDDPGAMEEIRAAAVRALSEVGATV